MTIQWAWEVDPGPGRIDKKLLDAVRDRVDQQIADNKDHYIGFLQGLLRFKTVSGGTDPEEKRAFHDAMADCLDHVAQEAARLGMAWRDHEGVAATAEMAGTSDEGGLGIATHLDVVPATGVWRHPPFDGDLVDGEVWGRGAQDDKGPVAMAFAALDVIKRMGLRPRKDIKLFFGTQEETDDWPDMDLLLEREDTPEFTLVPDGAFPLIVGEKGIMTVEWQADWKEHDVEGPRFVALRSGDRHNVVPGEARVWLACGARKETAGRILEEMGADEVAEAGDVPPAARGVTCMEGLFKGKSAHAAFPGDGDNAALKALQGIHGHFGDKGAGRFARFLLDHCSDLDAAGLGLDESHTHMGASTLNLGVVEMGPTHGHAQVNVRFPVGISTEDVQDRFDAASDDVDDMRITNQTRGRPQDPIYLSPEDHPHLIHALQACYHVATGREPRLASLAGTTYAKIFPLAMAFGPQDDATGEPVLAHQTDERLQVERFLENIRIYSLAVAVLACDEDDLRGLVQEAAETTHS